MVALDFPTEATLECPYDLYTRLRQEAPVYRVPGHEVYFVSRWEDIVYVAEHPERFSAARPHQQSLAARAGGCPMSAGALSDAGLSSCDGEEHRIKRQVALKFVSPARLRRFRPLIKATVDELIDDFAPAGEVEFASAFAAPLPRRVVCAMLGVQPDDDLLARTIAQAPASVVRFISDEAKAERQRVGAEMAAFMEREIRARHARPRDDFLSELVTEHVALAGGELPLEYLIGEATTLLFGGLVTTQHLLTNTLWLLLEHRRELERVLADRTLIRPLLEESLRLESPFHLTEMICTADTELGGVTIPAGAAVYKVWGSGNRDEAKFEAPEAFRIGRRGLPKSHLGFGRGSHRCLGAPLALLEGELAFAGLLERCRDLRFAPGRNDWTHVPTVSFRSLNRLYVKFTAA